MAWRGQGGRRAKGAPRRPDPELDSTAWLEELEREAAQDEDDEEDWASTPPRPPGGWSSTHCPAPQPPPDPGWSPASDGRGGDGGIRRLGRRRRTGRHHDGLRPRLVGGARRPATRSGSRPGQTPTRVGPVRRGGGPT